MKKFLTRLTGLEDEELKKASVFQLILFLIVTSLLLLKPTVNSVFISVLGVKSLPFAYLATAFVALIGSRVYQQFTSKYSIKNSIQISLYIAIAILLVFGIVFNFHIGNKFMIYALYVFISIYGLLTTSQFWLLTKATYNVREAKRCYGYIGAGGIAGGIFGGYLASILTRFMPVESIIFVAIFILLLCFPLYRRACSNESEVLQQHNETNSEEENPLKIILNSKLLFYNALVVFFSVIAAKLIDYQYSDLASQFAGNKEDLGAFFGIWLSNISIISLIFQLFLTKPILRKLGVTNSLLVMPGGLFISSFLFIIMPELWVAVLMKIIDGSMKQSLNKSARELVYMPLPLEESRATKSYIDVVVDSVATGIAGVLLYVILARFPLSSQTISFFVLILIGAWIYYIFKLKIAYRENFRVLANIQDPETFQSERTIKNSEELDIPTPEQTIEQIVKQGGVEQKKFLLDQLINYQTNEYNRLIIPLVDSDDNSVKQKAYQVLADDKQVDLTQQALRDQESQNIYVAAEAFGYLAKHKEGSERSQFLTESLSPPINIKYLAATIALSNDIGQNGKALAKTDLIDHLDQILDYWKKTESKTELSRDSLGTVIYCAGNNLLTKYFKLLEEQISSLDSEIAQLAMKAAVKTKASQFVLPIALRLHSPDYRSFIQNCLKQFGSPVTNELLQLILSGDIEEDNGQFVPEIIGQFKSKESVKQLMTLVSHHEYNVQKASCNALQEMKDQGVKIKHDLIHDQVAQLANHYRDNLTLIASLNHLNKISDLSIPKNTQISEARNGLVEVLHQQFPRSKQLIGLLLPIIYGQDKIEPVVDIFNEGSKSQTLNALEYLNELFDGSTREHVIPILESQIERDSKNKYQSEFEYLKLEYLNESTCIQKIIARQDVHLLHSVLYLIEQLNEKSYVDMIQPLANHPHKKLRQHAQEVIEHLQ